MLQPLQNDVNPCVKNAACSVDTLYCRSNDVRQHACWSRLVPGKQLVTLVTDLFDYLYRQPAAFSKEERG